MDRQTHAQSKRKMPDQPFESWEHKKYILKKYNANY